MRLNFNFAFRGLDGKEVPAEMSEPANKVLGHFISGLNSGNSIKLWDWALTVYKGGPLEVDATDADMLSALIDGSDKLTVLAKVQLLDVIKRSKKSQSGSDRLE